jgi:hypothetical protein
VYYALSQKWLTTYVYARCLDLSHIVFAEKVPTIAFGIQPLRLLLSYSLEAVSRRFMNTRMEGGVRVLIEGTIEDDPNKLDACIKAGRSSKREPTMVIQHFSPHAELEVYLQSHILFDREQS